MKKLLFLCLFICLNLNGISVASAEENHDAELVNEAVNEEVKQQLEENEGQQEEKNSLVEENSTETKDAEAVNAEDISVTQEPKVEYEEVRKVEREIIPLPACDDEKLIKEAFDYIKKYFDTVPNEGTVYRRRRYFILNNLDKFKEVNVENYKTAATSPVSDIIADVKVNKGIVDENLRLCKNQSPDKYAGEVYALIYPVEQGYEVRLINLSVKQTIGKETSFIYKN